jgi:hypothetical protein
VVDAEADIAAVGADVVDSVGDDLAEYLVLEVVDINLDRLALPGFLNSPINSFFFVSTEITG